MESFSAVNAMGHFSAAHLTVLSLIALVCVVAPVLYRKSCRAFDARRQLPLSDGKKIRRRPFFGAATGRYPAALVIGCLLFFSDVIYYIVYIVNGWLTIYLLPLHLCTMAIYIIFLHSLIPADWIGQVLYALCLPGAWCALVFPDWVNFPFFSYTVLRCFAVHGLIVIYIIMQVAAGVIRPRLSAIWKPVLFLCVIAPPIMILNRASGANYLFLMQPSAGSPLEILWNLADGEGAVYILLFALLTICGMTVMYLPFGVYRLVVRKIHG